MELKYSSLESEFLKILDVKKNWILASTDGHRVSARSMSIINNGLDIYLQTNKNFEKYNQISLNKNIALCCSNVSMEGTAYDVGTWEDNLTMKDNYIKNHENSYKLYGTSPGQVVIKIIPHLVVFWNYIDSKPARDFLYIAEKKAERLFYFDQYPELNREKS